MFPTKTVSKFISELHTVPGVPSSAGTRQIEFAVFYFLLLEHAVCTGCCVKGPNLTIRTRSLISGPYELTRLRQHIMQIPQSSRNSLSSLPTFVPIVHETLWSYRLEHCIRYTGNFSSRPNTPWASPPRNSSTPISVSDRLSMSAEK